jgi:hypothetical protein
VLFAKKRGNGILQASKLARSISLSEVATSAEAADSTLHQSIGKKSTSRASKHLHCSQALPVAELFGGKSQVKELTARLEKMKSEIIKYPCHQRSVAQLAVCNHPQSLLAHPCALHFCNFILARVHADRIGNHGETFTYPRAHPPISTVQLQRM